MPHYVAPDQLAALVRQSQAAGSPAPDLLRVTAQMASGVWRRYFPASLDRDDFVQDCQMLLLKKLHLLDPDDRPFNYLTTTFLNEGRRQTNRKNRRAELLAGRTPTSDRRRNGRDIVIR